VIAMKLVSTAHVLETTHAALGLGMSAEVQTVDDTLLAQLLRAVAWSNCPCQPFVLVREVERTLRGLISDTDSLRARVNEILENLVATGDLLEPGQVTHGNEWPKGFLFPAPPSFAMLTNDIAQLFGVASEEELDGPSELRGRIVYDGTSRRVKADVGESLESTLRLAGLRELSMQAWLREPATASAAEFLAEAKKWLRRAAPADATIEGLEVFDSSSGGIYSTCWGAPGRRSGLFIARRPKAYGSTLWMLLELNDGRIVQLTHLPQTGSSFRGCDEAWRTQLALDAVKGQPQKYRVRCERDSAHLDMLFPIPLWAHRHLLVMGRQSPAFKSIFSYQMDLGLLSEAQSFLEQRLWLNTSNWG
jgi:hypothetical protein